MFAGQPQPDPTHRVIPAKAGIQYSVSWLEYAAG
jgi:hypothetical protein